MDKRIEQIENKTREQTAEVSGLVEERLTVEIPTEIQAGLAAGNCGNCWATRAN